MTADKDGLTSRRLSVSLADGDMAMLRFGRVGRPPLLFAHANGFCASAYRRMFEALGDRFDIFAVDLRGHGRTRLPASPGAHRDMTIFGDDLRRAKAALADYVAPGVRWTLAGHSLGAVAAVSASAGDLTLSALRLIEPVAMPRVLSLVARSPVWGLIAPHMPLVKGAIRRRSRWPDRQGALQSYAGKRFFAGWADCVLEDYLADGLIAGDDGVGLACSPAWEAATFAAQAHDFWGPLAHVAAPIGVLAARHPTSTLRGDAIARFRRLGAQVEIADDATHLLPFEAPSRAARFLAGGP